jgi:hypothetical protein
MTTAALAIVCEEGDAGRSGDLPAGDLPEGTVRLDRAAIFHAEPGLFWIRASGRLAPLAWTRAILPASAVRLAQAIGCAVGDGVVLHDDQGRTTRPGVFVAFADMAHAACAALDPWGGPPAPGAVPLAPRLDPFALAGLLERPESAGRDGLLVEQGREIGAVAFLQPLSLAELAAHESGPLPVRPVQIEEPGR